MLAIELNTAVKAHFTSLGSPYSSVPFYPLNAYEDTTGPFIIYFEYPGTQSEEQYFLQISNIVYYIYDTDIDRAAGIARKLDKFLNVGSDVNTIKSLISAPTGYGSLNYRITTSRKVSGTMSPPIERDGFAVISRNYRLVYVDVS